ncbi:MAG TPA: hypothetical protein VK508_07620 [Cyclobacteriaceae bacterium]|nr:hypothetical protein [Cyclobacteriaceae bacterium]
MKWKIMAIAVTVSGIVALSAFTRRSEEPVRKLRPYPKGCVFRTVMGEESSENMAIFNTSERITTSLDRGLVWMAKAQNDDGGWGAGSHARQEVRDPHLVSTDPATTSMVAMALLRTGSNTKSGPYKKELNKAIEYLLRAVEQASPNAINITEQTGTQIQSKLGQNIDVILTSQFLSNLLDHLDDNPQLKDRVKKANAICVKKIQKAQSADGSIEGSGWAGVLQSSFAANSLEAAEEQEIIVDAEALKKAKSFQTGNYNARTGEAKTDMGAGVVLYAVSGSSRSAAKEARKVREEMDRAKKDGRLPANAPASAENLEKIGFKQSESREAATAYEVYESAKVQAQRDDVMSGFGNNGGEEFLSYLQTGEGMVINKDDLWTKWYDNVSGRLLTIQNNDGSWNGHHCITSPVFCTATCLLILSVNNDVDRLVKIGVSGR